MKKLLLSIFGLLALSVQAQQLPQVPNDLEVRTGRLDNGLTYFIRHNEYPEHRATFMIAQNVGSIQEEDNQRGLAHFLEHMCFNGSDHFKDNGVIEYLRTLGVEFGTNLNASTDMEQTNYHIDRVPTDRISALDSCLLILKDWSCGLTLDDQEIDKERGVIHEEWRSRSNATMRVLENKLPELYPNNKYGYRFPIGTMDIIDNFKYQELKDYYKKWYHPENQCIIVVGDVDVDRTEEKIKELFAGIQNPANSGKVTPVPVEDNAKPIVVLATDKEPFYNMQTGEQTPNIIMVMTKHPVFDKTKKSTLSYLINRYLFQAVCHILNDRLNDLSQNDNCNFLNASVSDGDYLFSSTVGCFELDIVPKDPAHAAAALKEAMMEVRRAAEQGFSPEEYNRFKETYMTNLESQAANIASRDNMLYAREYMANFFASDPYPLITQRYGLMKQITKQIPADGVNQIMEHVYSKDDSNVVILNFNMEQSGATLPTKDALLQALAESHTAELPLFEGTQVDGELIKMLPKAGTVKSEEAKTSGELDYKLLTLSNGVKVFLKQTEYKKDEVVMIGYGPGGSSVYGPADFANLSALNDVVDVCGLGGLSNSDLKKALSGKKAEVGILISPSGVGTQMAGTCRPKDIETMLQLAYLNFTNITKDEKAYNKWYKNTKSELESRSSQPMLVFQDELQSAIYDGNARVAPMTTERLATVSYDRILQIAKERMASANGWSFVIVGNYDEETLKPLLCQYLGSLNTNKVNESQRAVQLFQGQKEDFFDVQMETPMSIAALFYINEKMPYTAEKTIQCSILGRILTAIYLKKIREDKGIAYTVEAGGIGSQEFDGYHVYQLQALCPTSPSDAVLALGMMENELTSMKTTPVDASTLDKVKKQMIKSFDEQMSNNKYWASCILTHGVTGTDMLSDIKGIISAQTPESIQSFVNEFLKDSNTLSTIMSPK